jgi:hypothetical protein
LRRERHRQSVQPFFEEGLDLLWTWRIGQGLRMLRIWQLKNPLSKPSKPMPSLVDCRLSRSWPFKDTVARPAAFAIPEIAERNTAFSSLIVPSAEYGLVSCL